MAVAPTCQRPPSALAHGPAWNAIDPGPVAQGKSATLHGHSQAKSGLDCPVQLKVAGTLPSELGSGRMRLDNRARWCSDFRLRSRRSGVPAPGSRPRNGPAPKHQRTGPPPRPEPTFLAAGQPDPGSDSQPKSGSRKIARNLILDFAAVDSLDRTTAAEARPGGSTLMAETWRWLRLAGNSSDSLGQDNVRLVRFLFLILISCFVG
jgi:hypothetical protein